MKKPVLFIVIFLVIAASFVIFPKPRQAAESFGTDIISYPARGFSKFSLGIKKFFSFIPAISRLKKENDYLTNKIIELEIDRSKIAELEAENNVLKKEIGFTDEVGIESLIPAKIILREPTSFLDSFVVDKGENNGVKDGAAVLSDGVLIGRIREVNPNSSKVILVTSKDSLVQAMLQNSRSKGILRGGISGLFLENIVQDTEYSPGEYVITSGLGGGIKQGILIGTAGKIQSSSSGIFKSIAIDPIIDMSKLELVFIEK